MIKQLFSTLIIALMVSASSYAESTPCPSPLDQTFRKLHSKEDIQLCDLYNQSKLLLLVNTASNCGFTKQFSALESLHQKYKDQGLVIVGFPSNSFKQEEKEEGETARVCYQNFGVTFNMTEHVAVKGDSAALPFKYVSEKTREPSWNFNKYLITKDGAVQHFGSRVKPLDSDLETAVIKALELGPTK